MKLKLFLITLFVISYNFSFSQNINQWRGEDRRAHYNEKDLLKVWPESGPELLFEIDNIGNGYGSPAIVDDVIYITGEINSYAYLFAFDKNGKLIWKTTFGNEWTKTFSGSRSTPTIIDDLIYVTSGLGNIFCFDLETGNKKWSKDLKKDFDGTFTMHGHSESPLILDDKVFLVTGGIEKNVVALERFSGKLIWKSKGKGERPAYNSPYLVSFNDRNILVTFTAYHLLGLDAETGELLWTHAQKNIPIHQRRHGHGDTHSNTIYYEDGYIYYFAGDGNGAVKLQLSENGNKISEIWSNNKYDNYMGHVVKVEDCFFGGTTAKKDLRSLNYKTGEFVDSLKIGSGSIAYADDMIYYYSQRGMVHLIKQQSGKLKNISNFKITKGTKEHFSHPVINKGKLFVRHGNILQVYKI